LNSKRIDQFTRRITDTLAKEQLEFYYQIIEQYQQEHNVPALEIAAALAKLVQGDTPLLLKAPAKQAEQFDNKRGRKDEGRRDRPRTGESSGHRNDRDKRPSQPGARPTEHDRHKRPPKADADRPRPVARDEKRPPRADHARPADRNDKVKRPPRADTGFTKPAERKDTFKKPERVEAAPVWGDDSPQHSAPAAQATTSRPKAGMERYRLDIGNRHGIKPGNIVGAITAEAGLTSRNIDQIAIFDHYTTVDLPKGMPKDIYRDLKNLKISGQRLNISKLEPSGTRPEPAKVREKLSLPADKKSPRKQFKKKPRPA